MANNPTIINTTDTSKIQQLMDETEQNVKYFDDVTKGIIETETKHLDKLMQDMYRDILSSDVEIPLDRLERYHFELTNLLYFMGEKLEKISVRNDLAKAAAKEVYNKAYLDNQIKDVEKKNKTTIAENQAVAEQSAIYESTVQSMYNHAYKVIQYKVDAGYEMVKTISKLISRRMQEVDLTNKTGNFNFDPTKTSLME